MKILITGAGGSLGTGLAEALDGKHELILSDCFAMTTDNEYRRADLRNLDETLPLARGCDFIVHTPAWHGMHGSQKSEAEYWQLNVDGTFNIFQSALQHNVRRMVWVSSVSISHWEKDKYGFSKFIGEHLCGYYHRVHNFRICMLRPWDFTPFGSDFIRYGERLLQGGVDKRDVVGATVRAIEAVVEGTVQYDAFEIGKDHPFTPEEVARFKDDPKGVIEDLWPGYGLLIDKYKIQFPPKPLVCDLKRTKEVLGYSPRHNFGSFLAELQKRDAAGRSVR